MFRCEWCEQMLDECELADWCVEWLCEECAENMEADRGLRWEQANG